MDTWFVASTKSLYQIKRTSELFQIDEGYRMHAIQPAGKLKSQFCLFLIFALQLD